MAKVFRGRQTVPLEAVDLAQAFQFETLLNALDRTGCMNKAEVLAKITRIREKSVDSHLVCCDVRIVTAFKLVEPSRSWCTVSEQDLVCYPLYF